MCSVRYDSVGENVGKFLCLCNIEAALHNIAFNPYYEALLPFCR